MLRRTHALRRPCPATAPSLGPTSPATPDTPTPPKSTPAVSTPTPPAPPSHLSALGTAIIEHKFSILLVFFAIVCSLLAGCLIGMHAAHVQGPVGPVQQARGTQRVFVRLG